MNLSGPRRDSHSGLSELSELSDQIKAAGGTASSRTANRAHPLRQSTWSVRNGTQRHPCPRHTEQSRSSRPRAWSPGLARRQGRVSTVRATVQLRAALDGEARGGGGQELLLGCAAKLLEDRMRPRADVPADDGGHGSRDDRDDQTGTSLRRGATPTRVEQCRRTARKAGSVQRRQGLQSIAAVCSRTSPNHASTGRKAVSTSLPR